MSRGTLLKRGDAVAVAFVVLVLLASAAAAATTGSAPGPYLPAPAAETQDADVGPVQDRVPGGGGTASPDPPVGVRSPAGDPPLPTAVDPLTYSTFLGGNRLEYSDGIAVDAVGNVYVAGATDSPAFPTTLGAFDVAYNGGGDAFVAKLDRSGALVFATFLGGSGEERARAVGVDGQGNVYVTGFTDSADFPVTPGAFQGSYGGGFRDGFVLKLSGSGSTLLFSTFLGGNNGDEVTAIAVDATGSTFLTGTTSSSDFPITPGAFDATLSSQGDAFVTSLTPKAPRCATARIWAGSDRTGATRLRRTPTATPT